MRTAYLPAIKRWKSRLAEQLRPGGLRAAGNLYGHPQVPLSSAFGRSYKRPSRTMISYLTASEAITGALDTALKNYDFVDSTMINALTSSPTPHLLHRIDT